MSTVLGNLTSGIKDWYQDDSNTDTNSIKGWINANKDDINTTFTNFGTQSSDTTNYDDLITSSYQNLFGRNPTEEGLVYWNGSLSNPDSGVTTSTLNEALRNGAQGYDLTYLQNPDTSTYNGVITSAFQNLFGRDPEEEGLAYWGRLLADPDSGVTTSTLNDYLKNGAQGDDLTYLYNTNNGISNNAETDDGSTPFSELITRLQGEIDEGKFDQSDFLADYQNDLDNYSANIDAYTDQAVNANNAVYRDSIDPAIQSTLNSLASRNMINSSVSGDTLSKTLATLATENATQNAAIEASGIQSKLEIPELKADALSTAAQTLSASLLPYQTLMDALEIDMYKYTNAL